MSSSPWLRKRRSGRHLRISQMRRCTAIRGSVMLSPAITGNTTTQPRLTLPTVGRANFYISNCGEIRSFQPFPLGQCVAAHKEIQDDKKHRDRAVRSDDFQAV